MKPLIKTYKSGNHLFHENDRSRELYIIQSGNVKVYRKHGNREIELAVLGKGAVLGEMALIDGKPRSASAKAIDDCTVALIDSETFSKKIAGVPSWFMTIVRMASQKIRQANLRLKTISCEHQDSRIIISLFYLLKKFNSSKNAAPHTIQQHLIRLLGITADHTTSVIDFLKKHKFIQESENQLTITSLKTYWEYCEFLRLYIRNHFNKVLSVSQETKRLLIAAAHEVPVILQCKEHSTMVNGELFWKIVSNAGLCKSYGETLSFLKDNNLLSYTKNENVNTEKSDNPLIAYQFKISNTNWKKACLYYKYNQYIPLS